MQDDLRRLVVGTAMLVALVVGLVFLSRDRLHSPVSNAGAGPAATDLQVQAAPAPPLKVSAPVAQRAPVAAAPAARASLVVAKKDRTPAQEDRIEFPANLPSAFTPAGFHDAIQRTIAACKFPLEITEEDCSEFPCIAWGKWNADSFGRPRTCAAWQDTFGDTDFGIFYVDRNDGIPRVAVGALLPGTSYDSTAMKHVKVRSNAMMKAQGAEVPDEPEDEGSGDPQKRAPKERASANRAPEPKLARAN